MNKRKFLLIGLDCADPHLIFDQFRADTPNLQKLIADGLSGVLRTTMPPITIPAWIVMLTGKNPGKLGFYGFRHRKANSYTDIWIANPRFVQENTVWDILGKNGRPSCVFAFPPSFPPPKINGTLVSCFLTPSAKSEYTQPQELKIELEQVAGPYIPDISFRTKDRDTIKKDLFDLLENHMRMIKHLLKEKPWDFFMFVDIGVDRAHHAFWKYHDPTHHLYEPNSKYKDVIREYYAAMDRHIGEILELVDSDTFILVASDHGVKPMRGAFCINEWLIKEGYLKLKKRPPNVVPLEKAEVDWKKTKAWAWGGYYSRVFLNVKNREPQGRIKPRDYEKEMKKLQEKLSKIKDPAGRTMDNFIVRPEEYYNNPKGDYPDLMVVFDDLYWRAAGTLGHDSLYLPENDTGPDDAMHDWDGIYILYDPNGELPTGTKDAKIEDIAPTILTLLDEPIPSNIDGKVIFNDGEE
ncbi:MAG: alkaline phosphatase family protein [Candidatus Hodarchaeota archaeon]